MLTTIELFAGAGGLALGVEKAGFKTIGLVEFNKDACDTLKLNRPEWNVIYDDIANVSGEDLERMFGIKKVSWICCLVECFARHFLMQGKDLD